MSSDARSTLALADALVRSGQVLEAIRILSSANRSRACPAIESRLVGLRHQAWGAFENTRPVGEWPRTVPDVFGGARTPPECDSRDLTVEAVSSAMLHHGCLIVRGLIGAGWCRRLRDDIDLGIEAARRWLSTDGTAAPSEWFSPFEPAAHELTRDARAWVVASATAYTPESPRTLFDLLEAFDAAKVDRLLAGYFGERPAFSLIKSAFRRTPPDTGGGWHQDGYVAGLGTRALNVWVALNACGSKAPGLDLVPRKMRSLLPTATGLAVDFCISPETVAELARETPIVRPEFEAGDAMLFDQWLVHQTGWGPGMTEPRYGFECWFFAPSTFPVKWYPFIY
jgi:hypothetical protein